MNMFTNRAGRRTGSVAGLIAAMALLMLIADFTPVYSQTMMQIPPHYTTYTGYVRGYWFVAPTDFYVLGMRVPTNSSTSQMQLQLMRLASPPPVWSACTSNFTTLFYNGNIPGTSMVPMKILIKQGDVVGVIGSRWSTAGGFSSINSYTSSGNYNTTILGQQTTLKRFLFQGGIMTSPANCVSDNSPGQLGRVELYYGPPCEVPDGSLEASLVDASGVSQAYAEIPGTVWVKYRVSYPAHETDVKLTLDFYPVNNPGPTPAFSVSVTDTKPNGQDLIAQQMVNIPTGVQPGYYKVIPTFNTQNSCDEYQDTEIDELTFMLVNPGTQPCIVWPGDVNNDALVNYGDRKSLTNYIHEANLNPVWLNGPARYRSDAGTNPLTYLKWEAQAAVPWNTPDGCYMDTDGNGTINNFDFIAIKTNWMRSQGDNAAKNGSDYQVASFDVSQNFPNPFNPSTQLNVSVPERSHVRIVVTDMLGREVATLIDETVEEGTRTLTFDATTLQSGNYVAVASMQGIESGLSFSKTVRMTLAK